MAEMTLEVKAPQDAIDIFPQERITGDILRGHGPRRGNLEQLLKFWRPIMRKPGGFRRCIIILANHPELYPLQPLCAWLHHETTGQWPNEGNHHAGGKLGPVLRVARRAIPGKRRRRGRKSDDCGLEIASWRLYRRWAREIKGVTTRPINGSQNAVEYKAARFMAGTKSVPVPGSFDWDENHTPRNLTIYEKVGMVRSHGRLGRTLQSLASFFIPGDMGKYRNPGRSALYGALTPGGGGGGRRGGLGSISGSALRCPSGYLNGGRFADPKLTNCGGLILDAPAKGPGAITAVDRDKMKRRFQQGDDLPSVARDVVAKAPEGDPFAVVRAAATKPKSKPDVKRRDSAVKDVAEYAQKNPNTIRVVRRDGVVYEPRVGPEELVRIKDHDAFKDAAWVTSKIPRSGGLAGDEVRLLTKGVKSVNYVFPDGIVKVERQGEISAGVAANMRTRWAAISRDPDVKFNPVLSLERWVTEFKNEVQIKYSGKIKNGNERIVVYDVNGMRKIVPRWVFQLYLSERAPRRMGNKKPHYLAEPQIEERGRRPEGKNLRPARNPYVASFVQQKALAKYVNPLPVRDQSLSLIRISGTTGLSKDSLIEMKAAFFNRSVASSDISVKVFGRRRRGLGRISSFARRMPKVVPYERHARDGDNDGIVQEGTIWERPAGAVFRGIVEGARRLVSSAILEDSNGGRIDYKPGDHARSPLRQMSRRQVRRAGRVDRVAVGQEDRIGDRDRRLIAEGEAVDRGEVDESVDRVRRRVLRAMGSPERRRARAGRHRERADRDVARAQSDIERAGELRRLREERDAFDREVAELDERHRGEREGLMERDPRNQRRRDRRQGRRGEPETEEEEAEPARERTGPVQRLATGFARGRDAAVRRRDEREDAEVDHSERDRRIAERRERRYARLDRFAGGQDEAVGDRDRELDAQVDKEELDGIVDRLTRPLRRLFENRGFRERREEDDAEVRDRTGHSVGEHIEILDGGDATILDPTPDEEARDVQDLIEAVRVQDDGSLPDDRSLRNVGNRFPQRGLPERAFWRDDDYEPGGGRDAVEQRELHERRFGRYFDGDGDINDRGLLVNKQLEEQREAAEAPEVAPGDVRDISEVMAEAYPNRPGDMSQEAIQAEMDEIDAAFPDMLDREFLPGQRHEELEAALKPVVADGDRLSVEDIQRLVKVREQSHPDGPYDPVRAAERNAASASLVAAAEDLLTREEWDDDMRAEASLLMRNMPPPPPGEAEGAGIYHRLRTRELAERPTRPPETPDAPEQATTIPPTPDVPDVPAAGVDEVVGRIDAVSDAERPAQRVVERVRAVIVEQLGEEALQQVLNDWPAAEAAYGRDGAGERLLIPIRSAVDWNRPREITADIDNPAGVLLGTDIWGDDPPVVDNDASLTAVLVAVREKLATMEGDHAEGLALLRTRLESVNAGPREAGGYQIGWNDLAVRRRREWEEAGMPTSGELLEGRVLTQMVRRLQDYDPAETGGRLDALNEILLLLDNWDRDAIRRANPANQPGVPDHDLPWLQSVSQAIMGRRMNKIRAVAGERAARHGRPARFGLEDFGIERSWFESDRNLTADRKAKLTDLITEAYSLGLENRFTAPGNPDVEFVLNRRYDSDRSVPPAMTVTKSGNTIQASFDANISMRKRNADGSWGEWTETGHTSRSVYMRADGSGYISNGSMFNNVGNAKGLGFATVYNNYAWASMIETGLVRKVTVGPVTDGPVIWGRHGFDDRRAATGMVHFLGKELIKFDAGEESIIQSQNMRDEVERLVGAYHRDPALVTSMMGHSILQAEGRHPWERLDTAGVALADGDFPGAISTKYGQWWVARDTEGGVTYSPGTNSSDFIISESELARVFNETVASIRVDAEQLPEADRPRPPTIEPPNPADAIGAMSHQEMWAEMASMRSRWNDRALINMPDEIRERYEALVDAYDRAAPAGARRPDALGRSVV